MEMKGLSQRVFKCSFCNKAVRHIGEKEVEAGWGKCIGKVNGITVDMYYCPEHQQLFSDMLVETLASLKNQRAIKIKRSAQR